MTEVTEVLDRLVPRYEGAGDWERVLRDAGARRLTARRPLRLAAAVALVTALAAAVALWPSGGTGSSVLDRALAATGEGPVLHLVYEGARARTLVDLETGERTEVRSVHEVWFDPQAGLRETETFDGVVQWDVSLGPDAMSDHASAIYSSLGAGYREALESGTAEVVGEETVDGTPVYWIRISEGHEVAVSRETFAPAYMRVDLGGSPDLTRVVTYETVAAGSAPLDAPSTLPGPQGLPMPGAEIELADAAARIGQSPVWAGETFAGLPLTSTRELGAAGAVLVYGSMDGGAHVELSEAAGLPEEITMLVGVVGYAPPEGTALVAGTAALVSSNGLVVAIHATDEETALAAARALEPYSG